MPRTILHCDCNAFYASVETLLDPSLAAGPMAVCGDPESRHGIILAKNEAAKAYGVQTAETIWQAKRKCPDLRLVPPHREEYVRYSRLANQLYLEYTDLVEPFGIDESFLDVTGTLHLFGAGPAIADALRARMKQEIGLTISVGVSFNKAFAKLGSDYKKPDATTVLDESRYRAIVWPLPVGALLYAGPKAQQKLHVLGIETIGQLAQADAALLHTALGKLGDTLGAYARGEDRDPVRSFYAEHTVKSVGKGMTFSHNLTQHDDIAVQVMMLCDNVGARLRKHGQKCQTVQVLIRDPNFRNLSRQTTLSAATDSTRLLTETALALIAQHWTPGKPIRMITVTASSLVERGDTGEQLSLFDEGAAARREKLERLDRAVDALRGKYGRDAVQYGGALRRKP
ncbi:DNA polymerase IV [Intestinibacillus sp. Marseille-P6563]|uniref:DNA polymerase IV n=1 Tax=Intestinibacillus sp. Marseille-P6563 TaxID=2364792 RepID=UPI000F05D7A7|nr:DNA polymerase IV [Intestinibacillus sp. Marseille-P6563]